MDRSRFKDYRVRVLLRIYIKLMLFYCVWNYFNENIY